MAKISF